MAMHTADAGSSVLILVDLQPTFLAAIHNSESVLKRSEFLMRAANLLDVPVLATEQNPERMGPVAPSISGLLAGPPIAKQLFSCAGCKEFDAEITRLGRSEAVIVGIETHICVTQTALDLLSTGRVVRVCEDAVGARARQMDEIGFRRLRHAGVDVTHTESVVYEWMQTAEHPEFREVLALVKAYGHA